MSGTNPFQVRPETVDPEDLDWTEILPLFRQTVQVGRTELGRLLGVSYSTIRHWETGFTTPPAFLLLALRDISRKIRSVEEQEISDEWEKAAARHAGMGRWHPGFIDPNAPTETQGEDIDDPSEYEEPAWLRD